MSEYTPTVWETGDLITAEKLNNIEDGIANAPVPTGKKEITSTAEVDVASYATAQVVDEDLVAGNIKKDVDILGVVGTYEAPASDFSTAVVTVVNNIGHDTRMTQCCAYYEAGSLGEGIPPCITNFGTLNEGSNTFNVALYKGCAIWMYPFDDGITIATSGDVTNNDGSLFITGDCTITIS